MQGKEFLYKWSCDSTIGDVNLQLFQADFAVE